MRHADAPPHERTHARDLTVELLTSVAAAAEILAELDAGATATAFQTRLWLDCLEARLAPPRGARLLFCVVRSGTGAALMLLPLAMRTARGLRLIEGADFGVSDYVAPVLATAFEPSPHDWAALWPRLVAALPAHDVLRLTKVPVDIGGRPNPLAWIGGASPLELQAHGVAVSAPWPECAGRVFSANRREKLRKGWRELGRLGEVRFRMVSDGAEMATLFDRLVAQHLIRFEALKRREPLRDPAIVAFYHGVIERGAATGFARLAVLEVDAEPVAMMFGLCHAGTYYLLIQTFFDGPWARLAPGMLLGARMMQWAAEEGLGYFDFTIGNEDYKGRLGAGAHDLVEILAIRTWRGLPTLGKARLKAWAKRRPWLVAAVRRARGTHQPG